MAGLRLHNTLSGGKEDFSPLDPAHVRVYACGPTVYGYAHIGNARMAVAFDMLVRVLRHLYPKVTYVSNITDVDDKIMAAARETGEPIEILTRRFEQIYNKDMASLGVVPPDVQPRATEHIPAMVAQIQALIHRGHAYEAQGHALFHVPSHPAYGALSGRSRDEQIAGARVDVAPYKKDPADFVLWKPSADDQPGWDSPWGRGRPGWHIECSAMAEQYLAPLPFDIHGGGADLKFPHHENEIAQSCCAHGHENDPAAFAKVWVHNGFVTVDGEKMSKSIGNITLVHDLLTGGGIGGQDIRMGLLSSHYRQPLDWNAQVLQQAAALNARIATALGDNTAPAGGDIHAPVFEALCDDLNTPLAFARLGELVTTVNKAAGAEREMLRGRLAATLDLLGLVPAARGSAVGAEEAAAIEALVTERQNAKRNKDFPRADAIRAQLEGMGITVEDTPAGSKWHKTR